MDAWNPWKVTAIAMMVVLAVALVTGIVVASWTGPVHDGKGDGAAARSGAVTRTASSAFAAWVVPTQAAVDACNRYAAEGADKAAVIDGTSGGTLYGLHESRRNDERYRTAYGACMRAKGYTG